MADDDIPPHRIPPPFESSAEGVRLTAELELELAQAEDIRLLEPLAPPKSKADALRLLAALKLRRLNSRLRNSRH